MYKKTPANLKLQQELIAQVTQAKFEPDLALNLTLCSVPLNEQTNLHDKSVTEKQFEILEDNFKRFMCHLNESCYGRNWYRLKQRNPDKSVQIIAFIEVKNHQFHFHGAAQTPPHIAQNDFENQILEHWAKTKYGSKHENLVEPIYDVNGWLSYITKDLQKHNNLGYVSYSNFR
ncbi:hypothetical protein [Pseudoalteromonas sp. BDTF-M6]|uniref:hypothetical protein n=1 Tax=Pseudoalteromonas sp. BDTF-M6 TaxID=2796132 RepID=UPI001BAEBDE7|nr:hypothetical protein [Pseudoalteromonas sp. BDTF-M6]MBS3798112.1 hypothetical protein [Pseudoalteromonas sp. BDTF-M6]